MIVSGLDPCPDTVTVTVAIPGVSGNEPLSGGSWNEIELSLQLVMVSLAPSYGAPQLAPPWTSVR